ncbi:MAG TPA: metallopeptidase family protein [Stellaceae bacterium]|nr:metallopeptidase family protein [Stellaceae bacterium]
MSVRRNHGLCCSDAVVCRVLIHEIGHHFGFSDANMERIEGKN